MSSTSPAATIDRQQFRQPLGAFVTGITIVTTRDRDGRPIGLTDFRALLQPAAATLG